MAEEMIADANALRLVAAMNVTKATVKKLELKTLREVSRAAELLAAECRYYEPVRLLQGGGKSQHRRGK